MTLRKDLVEMLAETPRSISSLARELGTTRQDLASNLRHALRSAERAGHVVVVVPARCRACGFEFAPDKLTKPGRCPACRGTRIEEPLVRLQRA